MTVTWRIDVGDCRELLAGMDEGSVQTCVTSPPYFGLRDYGVDGQLGLEATPDEFVEAMVEVFREVRRVLRDDGTLWLNLGDSYAATTSNNGGYSERSTLAGFTSPDTKGRRSNESGERRTLDPGCKPKDLIGIPWMVAFALRADGWFLRSEIIWAKRNCMPESVTDRPTRAHEQIFLLSKSPRYFYDADAIREESDQDDHNQRYAREYDAHTENVALGNSQPGNTGNLGIHSRPGKGGRNKRDVWTVSSQPFAGAHFATFPPKLIEPCVLAGAAEGDTILDPFAGAGTTGLVALRHNRSFVGCELNPEYAELARDRIRDDAPLLNTPSEVAA